MKLFKEFLLEQLASNQNELKFILTIQGPNKKDFQIPLYVVYDIKGSDERFDYEYGDIHGTAGDKLVPEVDSVEITYLDKNFRMEDVIQKGDWADKEEFESDVESEVYTHINFILSNNIKVPPVD